MGSSNRHARSVAFNILLRVDTKDSYPDILLDSEFRRNRFLNELDRAFITELVYGTLRWRGRVDFIIDKFSNVKKLEVSIRNILRLAIYQLLFMDRVPHSATVNEAVNLTKSIGKSHASGFVNGVLRNIERKNSDNIFSSIVKDPIKHISIFYSHPDWLVRRWVDEFGIDETIKLCIANNEKPPITIRVNTLKIMREALLKEIKRIVSDVQYTHYSNFGLNIKNGMSLIYSDEIKKGYFVFQDEASQLIPMLLEPKPGQRILDACSAPGNKTTHLAEIINNDGEIFAVDNNRSRLNLVKKNCNRIGISCVKAYNADSTEPFKFLKMETLDSILLDAPCSGIGTLRRNPDLKWKIKEESLQKMQNIQISLLENTSQYLKDGGILVYSTCTTTKEENEDVIERFLNRHSEFSLEDVSKFLPEECKQLVDENGFLRTYTHKHNMDGFFAVRMIKI